MAQPKKKGGRPRMADAQRKSRVVPVRLSPKEHEAVKSRARSAGLSVSGYMRRVATGRPTSPLMEAADRRALRALGLELKGLLHQGTLDEALRREAQAALRELRNVLSRVSQAEGGP